MRPLEQLGKKLAHARNMLRRRTIVQKQLKGAKARLTTVHHQIRTLSQNLKQATRGATVLRAIRNRGSIPDDGVPRNTRNIALRYELATEELSILELEIDDFQTELSHLKQINRDYAALLREKEALIRESGGPEAAALVRVTERHTRLEVALRVTRGALEIMDPLLYKLERLIANPIGAFAKKIARRIDADTSRLVPLLRQIEESSGVRFGIKDLANFDARYRSKPNRFAAAPLVARARDRAREVKRQLKNHRSEMARRDGKLARERRKLIEQA